MNMVEYEVHFGKEIENCECKGEDNMSMNCNSNVVIIYLKFSHIYM
jgi:hypothetical protein